MDILNEQPQIKNSCIFLNNITNAVAKLMEKLYKLKNRNIDSILELVSIEKIMFDTKINSISARKKGLIFPFEYNYWFSFNIFVRI